MPSSPIHSVAEISQVFSSSDDVSRLIQRLVDEIASAGIAPAAVAYELLESGTLQLSAFRGVAGAPEERSADSIGLELERELLASNAASYRHATSLPLVTERGLYGVLVLLFDRPSTLIGEHRALLAVLADLAAAAISRAREHERMERAYLELKASREVLAKTEKLRLLGQMAAGVSHDLRNIFSGSMMPLELASKEQLTERAVVLVGRSQDTLRRGMELLERLKRFSRPIAEATTVLDLNRIARDVGELNLQKSRHQVEFEVVLGAPPPVRAETGELISAIINLIQNAFDAVEDGGHVRLETGGDPSEGWIRVADDGPGIPPEIREQIYEPFFTTKGDRGTGLGLAMIYAFVQRNGGRIDLDSEVGRGSTFTIRFPAV